MYCRIVQRSFKNEFPLVPQWIYISVALRGTAVACVWRLRGSSSVAGAAWRAAVPFASTVPCPTPTPAAGYTSPAPTWSAPTLESLRWVKYTLTWVKNNLFFCHTWSDLSPIWQKYAQVFQTYKNSIILFRITYIFLNLYDAHRSLLMFFKLNTVKWEV